MTFVSGRKANSDHGCNKKKGESPSWEDRKLSKGWGDVVKIENKTDGRVNEQRHSEEEKQTEGERRFNGRWTKGFW